MASHPQSFSHPPLPTPSEVWKKMGELGWTGPHDPNGFNAQGVGLYRTGSEGMTTLMVACMGVEDEMTGLHTMDLPLVFSLLAMGADPTLPSRAVAPFSGTTLVHCIPVLSLPALVPLLVEHGMDINARDADGYPLMVRLMGLMPWDSEMTGIDEALDTLLDWGADPHLSGKTGNAFATAQALSPLLLPLLEAAMARFERRRLEKALGAVEGAPSTPRL